MPTSSSHSDQNDECSNSDVRTIIVTWGRKYGDNSVGLSHGRYVAVHSSLPFTHSQITLFCFRVVVFSWVLNTWNDLFYSSVQTDLTWEFLSRSRGGCCSGDNKEERKKRHKRWNLSPPIRQVQLKRSRWIGLRTKGPIRPWWMTNNWWLVAGPENRTHETEAVYWNFSKQATRGQINASTLFWNCSVSIHNIWRHKIGYVLLIAPKTSSDYKENATALWRWWPAALRLICLIYF